ncbi:hypothetical protein D6851_15360 [Altericroceibacterium spongiae]|uniref:Lipoprotein n=1 Tax=Altericroceibacterium spongiae TaxID=2320269 RepID=A0A420EC14_9SPHN|nr:hypothetical protein [Altericroceibacterium spongiae]RKF18193.1 hypothetical protein D6851_15360 [Altericroceibacterium spongiae]
MILRFTPFCACALLMACSSGNNAAVPGDQSDNQPYAGISEHETLHFTGTEPFWGGEAKGSTLTYSTPEWQDGETITVSRFGGRGGLSLSGRLEGMELDMMVTPGTCSDGMSGRTYPFTVTLKLAAETLYGCAWTDSEPFEGPETP